MNKEHVMEMLTILRDVSRIMNHLGTLMCDHFKNVTNISEIVDVVCEGAYTLTYIKAALERHGVSEKEMKESEWLIKLFSTSVDNFCAINVVICAQFDDCEELWNEIDAIRDYPFDREIDIDHVMKGLERVMKNEIRDEIRKQLGDDYDVRCMEISGNNGTVKNGFGIRRKGSDVETIKYGDNADAIVESYRHQWVPPTNPIDANDILENVIPQLVNYDKNKEALKDRPHRRIADLALQYRCNVKAAGGTFIITNNLGFLEAELYRAALKNCEDEWKLSSLSTVLGFNSGLDVMVGTNKRNYYGAAIVISDKHMEKLNNMYPNGYYIIPSSIHEILVVPKDIVNAKDIVQMVKDINASEVSPDEVLGENIYEYKNGKLEVVYVGA